MYNIFASSHMDFFMNNIMSKFQMEPIRVVDHFQQQIIINTIHSTIISTKIIHNII